MPISIDQFRMKAQQGDAERLEINSAGTGLHRKGLSRGGKVVEWMRDAVGARKASNRILTDDFVDATGKLIGTQGIRRRLTLLVYSWFGRLLILHLPIISKS